jgi:hypothetical protein
LNHIVLYNKEISSSKFRNSTSKDDIKKLLIDWGDEEECKRKHFFSTDTELVNDAKRRCSSGGIAWSQDSGTQKKTRERVISELVIADDTKEGQSFSPIDDLKTTCMILTIKSFWLPCLSGSKSESSKRGHQLEVPGEMKLLEENSLSCVQHIINIQKRKKPYAKTTIDFFAVIDDDTVCVEMKARLANTTYQKQMYVLAKLWRISVP